MGRDEEREEGVGLGKERRQFWGVVEKAESQGRRERSLEERVGEGGQVRAPGNQFFRRNQNRDRFQRGQ